MSLLIYMRPGNGLLNRKSSANTFLAEHAESAESILQFSALSACSARTHSLLPAKERTMSTSLHEKLALFDPHLPLERARTIPSSWYSDPEIYAAEREAVFAANWQWAGRLDQLAEPGSFFTMDLAGEPIVVVRDLEGTIRAFHNVCRHRDARVVEVVQGKGSKLRCRYHGWTYDLAGRLRGTPEFEGVEEFYRDEHCLPELDVHTWSGLV